MEWKKENYTMEQKRKIASQVMNPITDEDIVKDFDKLKKIGCKTDKLTLAGLDTVNKFTLVERLDTDSVKGKSLFDFLYNRNLFKKVPSYVKLLKYYGTTIDKASLRQWFYVFRLYYGLPNAFRPIIAMEIYCRFKPTTVLDPTMGWGGRLVGACALDIPNYIGIDMNKNLKAPYDKLKTFLNKYSKTDIKLYFQDALKVDYSKIKYDMVLTSPPYYNIEIYTGTTKKSKDDWDKDFYTPLFEKTYAGLQRGGYYCMNIPIEVYERVGLKLLGRPTHKVILRKNKRTQTETYHEYIYVWKKP
jgi:hypothetical protein